MARSATRIEDHHAEWLSLVETSGPFLTVPDAQARAARRARRDAGRARAICASPTPSGRTTPACSSAGSAGCSTSCSSLRDAVAEATDADPIAPRRRARRHAAPDVRRARPHPRRQPAVLLVHASPTGTALDRPLPGEAWAASPIDRAAELARASDVPLALVTDGARWTLVWAREGETTGTCTWRAELWLEEPITLRAFATLLGARRFFSLPGRGRPRRAAARRAPASSRRSPTSSAPRSAAPSSC